MDSVRSPSSATVSQGGKVCFAQSRFAARDARSSRATVTDPGSADVARAGQGPRVTRVFPWPGVCTGPAPGQGSASVSLGGGGPGVTRRSVRPAVTRSTGSAGRRGSAGAGWAGRARGVASVSSTRDVSMVSVTRPGPATVRRAGPGKSATR